MVQKGEHKQRGCALKDKKTVRLIIVLLGVLLVVTVIMAGVLGEINKNNAYANTTFVGVVQEISDQSIIVATYNEVGFTEAIIDLSAITPYPDDLLPGEQLLIEILPQVSRETGITKATAVSVDKINAQADTDQTIVDTASGLNAQDMNEATETTDDEDTPVVNQVVIPLSAYPYKAPIEDVFVVSEEEISEILASCVIDELVGESADPIEILMYKQTDGTFCSAYRQDGTLYRFLTEDSTAYTSGFELAPYYDILGSSGFVLTAPRGAAYIAHDYYYFDTTGNIKMLLPATQPNFESDLDEDGQKEISYFYHGDREMYCFLMKNEELYHADITEAILNYGAEYPISFEPPVQGSNAFTVHYNKDGEEKTASLRIVDDSLELTIKN